MTQLRPILLHLARVLLVLVFLINGVGIVSPSLAIHDMIEKGVPVHSAELLCIAARIVDVVASIGLIVGIQRRLCAIALVAFLIPATLIAHAFWSAPAMIHQVQLINFFKNLSIMGGLLLVSSDEHRDKVASEI